MSSLSPLCPDCLEVECECDAPVKMEEHELPGWIYERHGDMAVAWWAGMAEESKAHAAQVLNDMRNIEQLHTEIAYDLDAGNHELRVSYNPPSFDIDQLKGTIVYSSPKVEFVE